MAVKVRERPKGSGIFWVYVDHDGKRKARRIGSKSEAMNIAHKIEAELLLRQVDKSDLKRTPLFKKYADSWLNDYILALRKPTTYERYCNILEKQVYPVLGSKPIHKITRSDIKKLLLQVYKNGYSKSTVSLTRDVLSGTLGYAVDEELIPANPVIGVLKRLNLECSKRAAIEPFNPEEVTLFLNACSERYPEYYTFFLCAFRTGMRLGELLALQWGDIDWNSKFIRVERSYRRGHLDSTKTGTVRRVDMSDQLAESLKVLLTQRKREALKSGKGEPAEIVFHREGKHMEQNFVRRVFLNILKKAGIRHLRIHDIRHSFASLLLSYGESPVYVKEQLGHSSIEMTVDIYGHLIPSSNREAVNRLDSLERPATNPQLSATTKK